MSNYLYSLRNNLKSTDFLWPDLLLELSFSPSAYLNFSTVVSLFNVYTAYAIFILFIVYLMILYVSRAS